MISMTIILYKIYQFVGNYLIIGNNEYKRKTISLLAYTSALRKRAAAGLVIVTKTA